MGDNEGTLALGKTPWVGPHGVEAIIAAVLSEALLYGMHAILFVICMYFLVARKMRLLWVMLAGIIVMFILSTADIALSFKTVIKERQQILTSPGLALLKVVYPKFLIYVTNNLIAVSLLIARFYVVWGQRKWLLAPTVIPLLVATGFGYALPVTTPEKLRKFMPAYFIITLVLNSVLTILTAWKIWSISRRTNRSTGSKQYRVTSAIIVESGMLYSISMIVTIALSSTAWVMVGAAIMIHISCIVPVLMIVQIAIGHSARRSKPQNKTSDIYTTNTHLDIRASVMLDTIIRTGNTAGVSGLGDSSMELTGTSHISSLSLGGRDVSNFPPAKVAQHEEDVSDALGLNVLPKQGQT